ncbi:hypothetical protein AtubIFM55763_009990 [Aspergillus tubingensis]|nr:hypothetical protein AtubIFM54640_003887 [Aspergillus tubingensis]GLA77799.1 hypothetical protein AtubIFM55763_009990 [Aspergillus tubingensis]
MAYNLNMGQHFRDETRQFIESSLDLDRKQSNYITDNAIICGFSPIADFIREEYDEEHRLTLAEEIVFVINMSKIEQENRLGTDIPSTDQYLAYRLGTNLMGVICAATEYVRTTDFALYIKLIVYESSKAFHTPADSPVNDT